VQYAIIVTLRRHVEMNSIYLRMNLFVTAMINDSLKYLSSILHVSEFFST